MPQAHATTAGEPIVAARAAAAPEVVRHGLLAEPEDAESLAGALGSLHREPSLRRRLAEARRRHVEQFDAPLVARRFLEVVEGLG